MAQNTEQTQQTQHSQQNMQGQQGQRSQQGQPGQQGSSSSSLSRRQPYGGGMARRGGGWDDFNVMRRQMDDLFSRFLGYTPMAQMSPMFSADVMQNEPDVDIYETEDNVEVYASLPGYTPDQINVECTSDSILISGERQPMQQDQNARQHRQSNVTGYSRFSVAYALPNEIDPGKVTANFQNGVLHLEMPIAEQAKPKTVRVNVAGGQQGQQPQLQSQEGQGGSQSAGAEQRQQRKAA